jgi:hypothetical protein
VINTGIEAAMIEFMITHDVNYMRKLKTTTLKKISEPGYSLLLATEVGKSTVAVRIEVESRMLVKI